MEYVLFGAFVLLLSPWITAVGRHHPHHGSILALVLLLGWTGIGWVAAWVWALQPEVSHQASRNVELRVLEGGAPRGPDDRIRDRRKRRARHAHRE